MLAKYLPSITSFIPLLIYKSILENALGLDLTDGIIQYFGMITIQNLQRYQMNIATILLSMMAVTIIGCMIMIYHTIMM